MIFRFELKGGNVPGTEARAAVVGDDVVVGEYIVIVLLCVTLSGCATFCLISAALFTDPGAVIHACEVKDGAWVQSGSILLDGEQCLQQN